MKKSNGAALIPIYVFLVLYLGLGILFEYVLKIPMGFYNIPIVVAFMVAIFVACLQNRKVSFDEKLQIMANGLTDKNIITMLLIFLTAGNICGSRGAEQCRECGILYAEYHSGEILRGSSVRCSVLCLNSYGNVCWNNNTSDAYRSCGCRCVRI